MKAIKTILILLLCVMTTTSCEEDDSRGFNNENGRFVRFFLQLDSNQEPIDFPSIELGITATQVYNKTNLKELKIPVSLTSQPLETPVTVSYSATINGLSTATLEPVDQFTFTGNQLVDTLTIKTNELWDSSSNPFIELRLTGSSDPAVQLGIPNSDVANDFLTINYNAVQLTYNLDSPSRIDITSSPVEEYLVTLDFPNGYLESDVINFDFFEIDQTNFSLDITRLPLVKDDQISFKINVREPLTNDDLRYFAQLSINNLPNYEQTGSPTIILVRDPLTDRDKSVNTASQFYNTADSFYRLYGVHWFDANSSGNCTWVDFNTFTNPIIVSADDPNAVLGDDNGTVDPSDDIYYHAFRIGFSSSLANRTTNPFNFKRWFTNEGSNADTSPGFNINPALEFFPENGNSTTRGTVQVIPQTIQIGTTASNGDITAFFQLAGIGTYQEIAPGIFEIDLEVSLTNDRILGGTRTDSYKIYNTSNFTDPSNLSISCSKPVALE